MKAFLKENWASILTALFLIAVGILLLVNPGLFSYVIIKIAGGLFIALGIYDMYKYFKATPEDAAKGSGFYSGLIMITGGILCFMSKDVFIQIFPALAVIYGVFQILLGYRKLQKAIDSLRIKTRLWWLKAISAAISIVFGFLITLNPEMTFMGIWVFTGISMIIEGIFDGIVLFVQRKKQ